MTESEFENMFDNLMKNRRNAMKNQYNRVLPSGEYIYNRFSKAEDLDCGQNSSVYDTSVVMGDVEIGNNVWVGPYTILEGINGKLKIGDYVSIDAGVMIYTHDTTKMYVSGGVNAVEKGNVTIGNNTVIGTMTTITCGLQIGSHCVIGAHSYVNRDIPDRSIAAGIPVQIIGEVIINEDNTVDFRYH